MDELYGIDSHLEMAYEDANGSALPEHLQEDDDVDLVDDEEYTEYDRETDYWMWSGNGE